MKKGEIYEGVIEKIDFQNKGRVKIKDTTVTVKNGIPGQKVRFMINKKTRRPCGRQTSGSAGKVRAGKERSSL